MTCEQKKRLADDYVATTATFAAAVGELQRRIGTAPKTEYEAVQRSCDEARVKSEQARLALEVHVASHGC
jgi:hypothetical protein